MARVQYQNIFGLYKQLVDDEIQPIDETVALIQSD